MSQINTTNIDATFPVQGQDNPSQGFRDNFSYIKIALDTAANEITAIQTNPLPNPTVLYSYTTSTLHTIASTATGSMVFVTDAPGHAQPCFFNGTSWVTVVGTTI